MSIADKITSIQNHLSKDYEAIENMGIDLTNIDKNIENIATCLNQIYDNAPKTSYAEGSNITLSNTLKGKLDFEDGIVGYGDTKQEGTPTPETPIDIEVARGKNRFEIISDFYISGGTYVSGANTNQFKITATAQDVYFNQVTSTNGTYTANNGNKISCRYGETIYFASGNEHWRRHFITEFNSSNTSLGFTEVSGTTGSYTPTHTDCSFITMRFGNGNGVSGTTYTLAPIVCKTSDTSYLPFNTLEVVERGKNLLDFSSWVRTLMNKSPNITDGSIDSYTDNSITITASGNDCFTASYTLSNTASNNKTFCETYPSLVKEVKGNTKYTISFTRSNTSLIARPVFFYLDENYNYLGLAENASITNNATFTTPYNAKYLTLRFGIYHSSGSTLTISNLMIEESESATTYEQYQTPQTYQLSLGEYEFAKIGNYVDTIEYDVENDKVYKNENVGKYVFNGSENWVKNTIFSNVFYVDNLINRKFDVKNLISEHFVYGSQIISSGLVQLNKIYTWDTENLSQRVVIGIAKDTVEDVIDFFSNNNSVLLYVKAQTTETEITGTLKDQIKALYNSQSFTGTTIIEINGQLPLIIKVRALKGE